jgi:hypothetical protein
MITRLNFIKTTTGATIGVTALQSGCTNVTAASPKPNILYENKMMLFQKRKAFLSPLIHQN